MAIKTAMVLARLPVLKQVLRVLAIMLAVSFNTAALAQVTTTEGKYIAEFVDRFYVQVIEYLDPPSYDLTELDREFLSASHTTVEAVALHFIACVLHPTAAGCETVHAPVANRWAEFVATVKAKVAGSPLQLHSMANFFDQQEKAVIKIILVNQPEALFITLVQVEDKWAVVDGSADELTNRVIELIQ